MPPGAEGERASWGLSSAHDGLLTVFWDCDGLRRCLAISDRSLITESSLAGLPANPIGGRPSLRHAPTPGLGWEQARPANPSDGDGIFSTGNCLHCLLDPPIKSAGDEEKGMDPPHLPEGDDEEGPADDEEEGPAGSSSLRHSPV